jgi:hypothetical protein
MVVLFRISHSVEETVTAHIKERYPHAICGWTYSFPIYYMMMLKDEEIDPFVVRDYVAEVCPGVNSEMGAIWRSPDGDVQLAVNPNTVVN